MPNTKPATALVVEGGALRSVYSSGLLDGFLDHQFDPFDLTIGVSAGAANLLFYLAGERGESYRLMQQIAANRAFIDGWRFARGGHLLDMDWLFRQGFTQDASKALRPRKPDSMLITATDINHGVAHYIDANEHDYLDALKASMSLPLLYRGFVKYRDLKLTDGGVADGIPLAEAIRRGARKIMVIRSRHRDYVKVDTLWHRYIRWRMRDLPALRAIMQQRIALHEQTKQLIQSPPDGVEVVDVAPPGSMRIGRFNRNPQRLEAAYNLGLGDAQDAIRRWRGS
jgi:predicted patatin/cPLA2 family phospholipase